MKSKMKIKIVIDFIMTILLLILMAYVVTGGLIHEIAGTAMLMLFIAHNIFNYRWYKNLVNGKYNGIRMVQTAVNLFLMVAIILSMISGIMMSSYVFKFLSISGGMSLARKMHMIASYWSFILMSLHLGLHLTMIMSVVRKAIGITSESKLVKILENIVALIIVIYGVYAFYKHGIVNYLFLGNGFGFFNGDESKLLFFVDYLAMAGMFVFVGRRMKKWLH